MDRKIHIFGEINSILAYVDVYIMCLYENTLKVLKVNKITIEHKFRAISRLKNFESFALKNLNFIVQNSELFIVWGYMNLEPTLESTDSNRATTMLVSSSYYKGYVYGNFKCQYLFVVNRV